MSSDIVACVGGEAVFQSLTGRLKTVVGAGVAACGSVFQSLTGRLKTGTDDGVITIWASVSIPHR